MRLDLADIRPSALSFTVFLIMVVLAANLAHFIGAKINVPGLSDLLKGV